MGILMAAIAGCGIGIWSWQRQDRAERIRELEAQVDDFFDASSLANWHQEVRKIQSEIKPG